MFIVSAFLPFNPFWLAPCEWPHGPQVAGGTPLNPPTQHSAMTDAARCWLVLTVSVWAAPHSQPSPTHSVQSSTQEARAPRCRRQRQGTQGQASEPNTSPHSLTPEQPEWCALCSLSAALTLARTDPAALRPAGLVA